ncbi:unnamed protein product [Pleuronectes platessa]|uniref:Uncharacterized protein n=1 Tax=Pleuronectes platessa TaxID=8262 RepID=A0A9N7YDD1_PLEPL|nr:unnamed protein product [Pleuronectes platessa]
MQMGQTGDQTADLQVGGRPLYPQPRPPHDDDHHDEEHDEDDDDDDYDEDDDDDDEDDGYDDEDEDDEEVDDDDDDDEEVDDEDDDDEEVDDDEEDDDDDEDDEDDDEEVDDDDEVDDEDDDDEEVDDDDDEDDDDEDDEDDDEDEDEEEEDEDAACLHPVSRPASGIQPAGQFVCLSVLPESSTPPKNNVHARHFQYLARPLTRPCRTCCAPPSEVVSGAHRLGWAWDGVLMVASLRLIDVDKLKLKEKLLSLWWRPLRTDVRLQHC